MIATTVDDVRKQLENLPLESLILVDVDDTLITPASKVFRATSPYRTLIDELKKDKGHYPNFEKILSVWRLQRKPMLVSDEWPRLLREQQRHHNVYALTKMDTGVLGDIPSMEAWRYDELAGLGLSFTSSFQGKEEIEIVSPSDTHPSPATFYKGIFITGPHSKGDVLDAFPAELRIPYVVMVDDREEYLEDVERACARRGVPFLGMLFQGMDLIPGAPDPRVAEFQKNHLLQHAEWLEDEVAIQRLQEN